MTAVQESQTILISGEVESTRVNIEKTVNISSEDGGTIIPTETGNSLFVVLSGGSLNISDLTIDGKNLTLNNKVLIEYGNGNSTLTNVTIKNVSTTSTSGICQSKGSGAVTLKDITIENCTVPENYGYMFNGKNDGIVLDGDNSTISVTIEKNLRIKAKSLTNTTPIKVYFVNDSHTEGNNIVLDCTDASKFNFMNCLDGYGVESNGSNLVYVRLTYVAKIGSQGYKTLKDAISAASAPVEEPYIIDILEDCYTDSRFIAGKDVKITFQSADQNDIKTITRFKGTSGDFMLGVNNNSGNAVLNFKNINLKNEDTSVTALMLEIQKGTISLDNVKADYPTSNNNLIQVKETGHLILNDAYLGNVYLNKNGYIDLSGNNYLALNLEAADGSKFARITVTGELTNTEPIEFLNQSDELDSYIGFTLIGKGTEADIDKFKLPEGYVFEASNDGLVLQVAPVYVDSKDEKTITFKVTKGNIVVEIISEEPINGKSLIKRQATANNNDLANWNFTDAQTAVYTLPDEGDGQFYKIYSDEEDPEKYSVTLDSSAFENDPENSTTGVEAIENGGEGNSEYFTLQGVKVQNPEQGNIYIVRRGNKSYKVVF